MQKVITKYLTAAKSNILPFCLWLLSAALFVAADQITKAIAVEYLKGSGTKNVIPYLFNFVYTENKGAAWGIFSDSRWVFIIVSAVAIVAVTLVLLYAARKKAMLVIPLVMILAGGVGNMIDRLSSKAYVVDFIQFDFFKSFPVFNVADIYVTVGGVLLMIYVIFIDRSFFKDKNKELKNNENNSDN